ncbi:hypothetical protein CHRY9390_02048 [Chryseobacterium aquaeductus]|uniref:Uncharacterized protein n=1 Tax=Chryseobacterium aquaeductus TaxID=2675056 RepID=A0A9N8QSR7_9FLAO|nr:hypothetical protein [Chryseobacterium aquaeductus]CAA7331349.1 hypothetical protein CHRY9390_02048 [Chryseobacterium potabilaquae]CAD7809670.1 hypothetical protein CHRY9390_02048 [Chryseobacterium aquaeductus]
MTTQILSTFIIFFSLSNCKPQETTKYVIGQEWNYKTRKSEENSTLKILKIEEYPTHGKVIHISIGGLKVGNPNVEKGFAKEFTHIPITEEALNKSVTELKNGKIKLPDYIDGYNYWKKEFDQGIAGVFSISVSEIVDLMEESIITGNGVVE